MGAFWGIDIGDSAVKAVKLRAAGKRVQLLDFHVVRYSDIGGEPGSRREGYLPQALAALQAAGAGSEPCFVSIAPQTVFSRFISLPPVDKRRVPEIVLYEARQQIPFNLNEVVWAYESVRKQFIPGEEIEIGLFAVKREVIDAYLAELSPLWKRLEGIQMAPLGLYNFLRHDLALEQPTIVIDIGAQSTDLLILDGDKFWLRNLPIAGNTFTTALEKKLNVTRAEAEKQKLSVSDSRFRRRLLEVMRPVMRDLVAEIQRSVGYYKSLAQAVRFEEVLVAGDGFRLLGLDRYLADQLQYKVTPIQQLHNVDYQAAPERQKEFESALPGLAVAMGLALQGIGRARTQVNLLPEGFLVQRAVRRNRLLPLAAAVVAWGIAGCFYLQSQRSLKAMADMNTAGENTLKRVQDRDTQFMAAQGTQDTTFLQTFGTHREYISRVIGAMSLVIPRDYQVDLFTFTTGAVAAVAADDQTANADEVKRVKSANLVLSFKVTVDGRFEPPKLTTELREHIMKAVIYWQKAPLVKGVVVGRLERRAKPSALQEPGGSLEIIVADVWVGLLDADEADTAAAEKAKEDAKAAEDAAKKAAAAAAAAPAPAPAPAPVPAPAPGP